MFILPPYLFALYIVLLGIALVLLLKFESVLHALTNRRNRACHTHRQRGRGALFIDERGHPNCGDAKEDRAVHR
jgi:hypothetical protein